MEKAYKTLRIWYYIGMVLLIIVGVLGYYAMQYGYSIDQTSPLSYYIYTGIVLYSIIAIPFAFKGHNYVFKKLTQTDDQDEIIKKYLMLSKIRLAIVAVSAYLSIFFYYLIQQKSLLYLVGIAMLFYFLSRPQQDEIDFSNDDEVIEDDKNEI